jgi:hypothetical protein
LASPADYLFGNLVPAGGHFKNKGRMFSPKLIALMSPGSAAA